VFATGFDTVTGALTRISVIGTGGLSLRDAWAAGASSVEAAARAQADWAAHVTDVAYTTLFPCAESWYVGANIPGKPRIFTPYVGGVGPYRERCDAVVPTPATRASRSVSEGSQGPSKHRKYPKYRKFRRSRLW
jgi:hypothetical protein